MHSANHALLGQGQRFDRLLLGEGQIAQQEPTARVASTNQRVLSPQTTRVIPVLPREWLPRVPDLAERFQAQGTPLFQARILLGLDGDAAWLAPVGSQQPPTARDGGNRQGHVLAAACDYAPHEMSVRPEQGARILLWGSRDAASDSVLEQRIYANEDLLLDALRWLARRLPLTGIPPADIRAVQVEATDGQMQLVLALLVVVLPCLCLGGAMLAWWERR